MVTSLPASASTIENAVPHDPAPNTATLLMPPALAVASSVRVAALGDAGGARVEAPAGACSPRISSSSAVIAAMIRSVASCDRPAAVVRGRSARSTGSPTVIVIVLRGNRSGFFAYGASSSWAPHWATGITGQPVASAIRAAPVLPAIGHRSGSRVMVPSG